MITDLVLTERTASSTVSKESKELTTASPTSASSFGLVFGDLSHLRSSIDEIDLQLIALIERRLKIAESVAAYKKENNLEIIDSNREASLLKRIRSLSSDDLADLNEDIFKAIIRASCKHQEELLK
ncbi:chorismate mutase [Mogibacterium neglectum]|nr:chorismate mutase [Mogibacterium neglectum]WLD77052.1 chorismate mutase [Mogibacterium neglectum]